MIPETVVLSDSSVTMDLVNKQNDVWFTAKIFALEDNTARIQINEKSPLHPRYEAQGILIGDPKAEKYVYVRVCACVHLCVCVHYLFNGRKLLIACIL